MDRTQCPIGVFDSGVGGISVLRELVARMPNENYIFFGDSKNAPYGTKTLKEVQELTCADAAYLISQNVKALVVACNTATSAAINILREKYVDMPIIGIEPALKPAVHARENPRVLFCRFHVRDWWNLWSGVNWTGQSWKDFLRNCSPPFWKNRWTASYLAARIIRLCVG